MFIYMIIRLLWGAWWFVGLMMMAYSLASLFWEKGALKARFRKARVRFGYAFIWPLALFTPKGRTRIVQVYSQEIGS